MRIYILIFLFLQLGLVHAQDYKEEITAFRNHLNEEYSNPATTPLAKEDLNTFDGLPFFPINEEFRINARFERTENAMPFLMSTTTDRLPTYEVYGTATFEIEGKPYRLNIYQSHSLRETEEYKNHLFLPFTDETNGNTTYGGGRFIDLEIPEGEHITIDFNKAYHPYCAYNKKYSCPIPPKENHLPLAVKAGIRI